MHLTLRALLLLFFFVGSCLPPVQIQAHAANDLALAANRTLPLLLDIYRQQGLQQIAAAHSADEARASLQTLRMQWQPVWGQCAVSDGEPPICRGGAWETLRAAHDVWALALEQNIAGQPITLQTASEALVRLEGAYCHLRASLPADARARLPALPAVTCEVQR